MNRQIAAFDFITCALSIETHPVAAEKLRREMEAGKPDWESIVLMANWHLVTPALWVSLRTKGLCDLLPPDLQEYLQALYSLNKDRNRHLKEQVLEAVSELNRGGIEPVLLKGAAHLFTETFGDEGVRMMSDLDILIPKDKFEISLQSFNDLGYSADDELKKKYAHHHHYAPLIRPGEYASIELHRAPLASAAAHIFPPDIMETGTRILDWEGHRIRVLSPTWRTLHNILHSEIVDRNHEKGVICLRQLHDLVHTCRMYRSEIDWRTIRECMERHGRVDVLQSYTFLANRLLGLEHLPEMGSTHAGVIHFLRCRIKLRFSRLDRLLHRFSSRAISRHYGCEPDLLPVMVGRIRFFFYLLKKHSRRAIEIRTVR